MSTITAQDAIEQILAVLEEAFENPTKPWTYFTDKDPRSGLFGLIDSLDADEASRTLGGTSIAAHVFHVVFSLEATTTWIRGDRTRSDWSQSWKVAEVDDGAWDLLREQVRDSYGELREAILHHATDSVTSLGGAIGVVAHMAYHLGAVRQKLALLDGR
jgi:hypothetical protein